MRIILISLAFLLVVTVLAAADNDVTPGDCVKLIERDIGIPVHPEAGDNSVSLRFGSHEIVKVLSIDAETEWILVRSSDEQSGWITPRYISEVLSQAPSCWDDGQESVTLPWCPAKQSKDPHPSGRLRIATWNIANLHAENGKSIYTGDRPSEIRESIDYERIKCYVRMFDPDILAVQEVDGENALKRVVDTTVYNVHVSNRPKGSLNGKQNTGFAYKKGLTIQELSDVKTIDVSDGRLRYGTLIKVTHNGKSFKMLSGHLKSGCFDNSYAGRSCTKLFQQVPKLEQWIDSNASGDEPFIILGDFNRCFNMEGDHVWAEIDDSQPPSADLTTVTKDKCLSCWDNRYQYFIDHIVFDKRSWQWVEDSSFRHITYRQADKAVWGQISDHCPISVDLWVK